MYVALKFLRSRINNYQNWRKCISCTSLFNVWFLKYYTAFESTKLVQLIFWVFNDHANVVRGINKRIISSLPSKITEVPGDCGPSQNALQVPTVTYLLFSEATEDHSVSSSQHLTILQRRSIQRGDFLSASEESQRQATQGLWLSHRYRQLEKKSSGSQRLLSSPSNPWGPDP